MAAGGWFFDGSGYTFKPQTNKKELEDYLRSTLPRTPIKQTKRLKLYTL